MNKKLYKYQSRYTLKGLKLLRLYGIDPKTADSGQIVIKAKSCGKPKCKQCPHRFYAYHRNRWGERYLGVCDAEGFPREKYEEVAAAPKQTKIPGI